MICRPLRESRASGRILSEYSCGPPWRLGIPVHDSGADRDDREEDELQEIRPVENRLLIVGPQDGREPENDEGVERPNRSNEKGDPCRQNVVDARLSCHTFCIAKTSRRAAHSRHGGRDVPPVAIAAQAGLLTRLVLTVVGRYRPHLRKSFRFPKAMRRARYDGFPECAPSGGSPAWAEPNAALS